MMTKRNSLLSLLAVASLALLGPAAQAQSEGYPAKKPVSLVVGYAAGGSVDLVARTVAPELAKRLGQQVIVENAAGAGGTLGALKVVNAPADGYTLLLGSTSEVGINALTAKKPRYNALTDLAPVGMIGNQPLVLVGTSKFANAAAFREHVAARPGKLSYASSGIGTPLHLAGELVKRDGQLFMLHIPYRGAAPMVTDLLGGQVDFAVFVLSSALPHIQEGRMQAIGVTTAKRSPAAPNIPALAETKAFAGVDIGVWFGLFAPAKTPAPIQAQLQKELREVLRQPEVIAKLQAAGVTLTPDLDGRKFVRSEIDRFAKIVEFAKIETE
ncbi:Bug family tripartite tricarboxylate transporter substrate binding protein [Roseateles sp. DAIF2]|uniref:Bug family tripartite tricarboxylate transporter substrate binding protein n=1 Tax=Roseateles sp. DAIF2 TaxID=2714952 RepID=UPI00353000CC